MGTPPPERYLGAALFASEVLEEKRSGLTVMDLSMARIEAVRLNRDEIVRSRTVLIQCESLRERSCGLPEDEPPA